MRLLAAQFRGVRTVEIEGRRVTYASDAEMAAVLTDLERRIAAAQDGGRRRRILTSRLERFLGARVAKSFPSSRRGIHRGLRGGARQPAPQGLPAESGAMLIAAAGRWLLRNNGHAAKAARSRCASKLCGGVASGSIAQPDGQSPPRPTQIRRTS